MANKNFVVKNGLTVGNLNVDADSGNVTTTGSIVSHAVFADNLYYSNGSAFVGYAGSRGYTGSTGMGFIIARVYSSVSALLSDTAPENIVAGQFAIIDTGDVNNFEDAKLYLWTGSNYLYVTDLSGAAGITGPQGADGYTGSQGPQGVTGYVGSQGIQGDHGYTGSSGDLGYTGSIGYAGSQGIQGYAGSAGYIGQDGYTGSQGDTGYVGSQGLQGYSGSNGANGYTGSQGIQGYSGSNGADGYTGSQGLQGYSGSNGADGYTGSQGPIGYTGSTGSFTGTTDQTIITSNNTASTSTTTGALQVAGGAGIQGNIYSADGSTIYNGLLYTPRVTIGDTIDAGGTIPNLGPANPRVGDFWIVPSLGAALMYVNDADIFYWIQFTSLA